MASNATNDRICIVGVSRKNRMGYQVFALLPWAGYKTAESKVKLTFRYKRTTLYKLWVLDKPAPDCGRQADRPNQCTCACHPFTVVDTGGAAFQGANGSGSGGGAAGALPSCAGQHPQHRRRERRWGHGRKVTSFSRQSPLCLGSGFITRT